MERPSKRRRELSPDKDLNQLRARNDARLKTTFESIFEKYGKDFSGVGDEVDLRTGEIIVNNGHLLGMVDENYAGVYGDMLDELNDDEQFNSVEVRVKTDGQIRQTATVKNCPENTAATGTCWLSDDCDSLMGDIMAECPPVVVTGGNPEPRLSDTVHRRGRKGSLPSVINNFDGRMSKVGQLAPYLRLPNAQPRPNGQVIMLDDDPFESAWRAPPLPNHDPTHKVQPIPLPWSINEAEPRKSPSPSRLFSREPKRWKLKPSPTNPCSLDQESATISESSLVSPVTTSRQMEPNYASNVLVGAQDFKGEEDGGLPMMLPGRETDIVDVEKSRSVKCKRQTIKPRWTQQENNLLLYLWSKTTLGPTKINEHFRQHYPQRSLRATNDHRLSLSRKHSWSNILRETTPTASVVADLAHEHRANGFLENGKAYHQSFSPEANPASPVSLPKHILVNDKIVSQSGNSHQDRTRLGHRAVLSVDDKPRIRTQFGPNTRSQNLHENPRSSTSALKPSSKNNGSGKSAQHDNCFLHDLSALPLDTPHVPEPVVQAALHSLGFPDSKKLSQDSIPEYDSSRHCGSNVIAEDRDTGAAGAVPITVEPAVYWLTEDQSNDYDCLDLATAQDDADKRRPTRQNSSGVSRPRGINLKVIQSKAALVIPGIKEEAKRTKPLSSTAIQASTSASHSTPSAGLSRPQALLTPRIDPRKHYKNSISRSLIGNSRQTSRVKPSITHKVSPRLVKLPARSQTKSERKTKSIPSQVSGRKCVSDRKVLAPAKESTLSQRHRDRGIKTEGAPRSLVHSIPTARRTSIPGKFSSLGTPSKARRNLMSAQIAPHKHCLLSIIDSDLSDDELSVSRKTVGTPLSAKTTSSALAQRRKTLG